MASPKTLEALAELADIPFSELCEYEEDLFMGLMAEKQVAATAQHRLRKKFRDLKAGKQHTTAQQRFEGFFARVGGADSLAGLQHVPVSTLPVALSFLRGAPGAPSEAALDRATGVAYAKADAMLAAGGAPQPLTRDEIAAANLYTQDGWAGGSPRNLFGPLNAALRSEAPPDVKLYWGYIRLLQHTLFKLPKDESGTLFRGIKLSWPGALPPHSQEAQKRGGGLKSSARRMNGRQAERTLHVTKCLDREAM